jgi:malonyl-CoA/methylmalonyl-CoA synthetase
LERLIGPNARGGQGVAVRFEARTIDWDQLQAMSAIVAARLHGCERVALWAAPQLETCVAVVGALLAGVAFTPLNPRSGARELAHIVGDCAAQAVLVPAGGDLPEMLDDVARLDVTIEPGGPAGSAPRLPEPPADAPALIVYTSGTTGPPKGAVLSRGALAANLDALADAWAWTGADVLAHALPLFHVHGLVLGLLGPLRRGGTLWHLGRFSPEGVRDAFEADATMLFGVPTMYHRLAEALPGDARLARALARARVLVSGSAPLAHADAAAIERASGARVLQRYGLTETLILTAERADASSHAAGSRASAPAAAPAERGTVGPPLPGVALRLAGDDGRDVPAADRDTIGEVLVRGPGLFDGYLNRPDATAAAFRDGWFQTGDLATWAAGGALRIVGRRATDLIKSGGFKLGAGEIEAALAEHPAVAECAVTGAPDADLGERVVAWVVPADPAAPPSAEELEDHVAAALAPHKRPREVHLLAALPRNAMGKVLKRELAAPGESARLAPGDEATRTAGCAGAPGAGAELAGPSAPGDGTGPAEPAPPPR